MDNFVNPTPFLQCTPSRIEGNFNMFFNLFIVPFTLVLTFIFGKVKLSYYIKFKKLSQKVVALCRQPVVIPGSFRLLQIFTKNA